MVLRLQKTEFRKLDLFACPGEKVRIRQKEPFLITEQTNDFYRHTRTWNSPSD